MEHADVLISEVPKKNQRAHQPSTDIQGSAKTISALSSTTLPESQEEEDPWANADPWSSWQTPPKISRASRPSQVSQEHVDAIAAKVQSNLQVAYPKAFVSTTDMEMDSMQADKIASLEDR